MATIPNKKKYSNKKETKVDVKPFISAEVYAYMNTDLRPFDTKKGTSYSFLVGRKTSSIECIIFADVVEKLPEDLDFVKGKFYKINGEIQITTYEKKKYYKLIVKTMEEV